jgi:hypothetical protein
MNLYIRCRLSARQELQLSRDRAQTDVGLFTVYPTVTDRRIRPAPRVYQTHEVQNGQIPQSTMLDSRTPSSPVHPEVASTIT